MKIQTLLLASSCLLFPLMTPATTLDIGNIANISKNISVPKRGSSMKSVAKHYGKAKHVTRSRGRPTKKWPRITRWEYTGFTVYFEKHHVLHTVVY
jgi:hypothetical protein